MREQGARARQVASVPSVAGAAMSAGSSRVTYAAWHVHHFPDGTVGYEWALDREGDPMPFGANLGPQPPDGLGNGCPCERCASERLGGL